MDIENITKGIGVVTATFALIGGGATLYDKVKPTKILDWAPEYFEITDAPANGTFDVIVAREKHRDDCAVVGFTLEVKDSKYHVHQATPSMTTFSGPATHKIDKFGYSFTISDDHLHMIEPGQAQLLARIDYECPEGAVVIHYPDGLYFNITENS